MHDGIVGGTRLGQVMPDGLTQAPGDVDFNTKTDAWLWAMAKVTRMAWAGLKVGRFRFRP